MRDQVNEALHEGLIGWFSYLSHGAIAGFTGFAVIAVFEPRAPWWLGVAAGVASHAATEWVRWFLDRANEK